MNQSHVVVGHQQDELVVTIPYANLVRSVLGRWQARPVITDTNRRLGLTKINLRAEAAVRQFHDHDDHEETDHDQLPLDQVLTRLRRHFQDEYAGWVPTMGKNRVVERLRGSYVIDGGGTGRLERLRGRAQARPAGAGQGAKVGIVDTRLFPHPWLAGAYLAGQDELLPDEIDSGIDETGASHATFVAGLVLRQAPSAQLSVLAGLDANAVSDSWSVAGRIAELADAGVDVVNLSFGCTTEDHRPPLVLSAAVQSLPPQTVVVAAAGNHGQPGARSVPVFPAALDDVIAVGALAETQLAAFSPDTRWVDAVAPGVGVVSTCYPQDHDRGYFGRWSGTSFASAVVAGAIAAQVRPGVSSREAWDGLREQQESGPVRVGLAEVEGWPKV